MIPIASLGATLDTGYAGFAGKETGTEFELQGWLSGGSGARRVPGLVLCALSALESSGPDIRDDFQGACGGRRSLLSGQVIRISGCWELPFQTILFIEKV